MNAAPAAQLLLVDIAACDARARQADAARQAPPQAARVRELAAARAAASRELADSASARDALRAETARLEADLALVEARTARDEARLQSVSNPKDAQGLEHELASLARRRGELEDAQLSLWERLEAAEALVAEHEKTIADITDEGSRLSAEAKAHITQATAEFDGAQRDRAALAARVPAELLALYERLAVRSTGAALLRGATCEGCRMVLPGTELGAIAALAADQIANCPECGCVLVRTEVSGADAAATAGVRFS